MQAINKILREAEHAGTADQNENGSEEEWGGLSDDDVIEAPIDLEEEYIDEDKYTTVTVEAVSVDRDGLHKPTLEKSEDEEDSENEHGTPKQEEKKAPTKTPKERANKKPKFRYESKFDRDVENKRQRAKRRKK